MKTGTVQVFAVIASVLTILLIVPTTMALGGWTKSYQGGALDLLFPSSVIQTKDGGYATAIFGDVRRVDNLGYPGHFTESYELQIMKTTSNGEVQWWRNFTQIDDPNHETPPIYINSERYPIVQTSDQGYAVAGSGSYGFWMFKVDAQGKVVWSKTYAESEESPTASWLYSMIQTNDGGFALAGSTETPGRALDFLLIKTDSGGKAQWNQTYNSGSYSVGTDEQREDEAKSLIQTRDGGYAIVGSASLYRASTASIIYPTWMVKTDAQGKQLWDKGYDSPSDRGREYSIIQTTDGGYAIAGTQNDNFYLMKIDPTSQLQWSKTYGDKLTDAACSVVQLNDGGYAVAGTWTKINTTATVSTMGLLRLDSLGQTIWTKTYTAKENQTTSSNDFAKAMIRTSDGGYAIVGSTTYGSQSHQDLFFVKTEPLEQIPQPTTTFTPSASSTPTISTPTPSQTITPNDSPNTPTTSPTQTPTSSTPTSSSQTSSNPTPEPSPSIPEIPTELTIPILITTIAILLTLRKKKLN